MKLSRFTRPSWPRTLHEGGRVLPNADRKHREKRGPKAETFGYSSRAGAHSPRVAVMISESSSGHCRVGCDALRTIGQYQFCARVDDVTRNHEYDPLEGIENNSGRGQDVYEQYRLLT